MVSGLRAGSAERWVSLVQVVRLDVHPWRAADLDLAVLMAIPGGGCRLRVVSLVGSDLARAARHLLDEEPVVLISGAAPVGSCRVWEQTFDSADQAVAAVRAKFPATDVVGWVDGAAFSLSVMENPEFRERLEPWAYRGGDFQVVVATLSGMVAFGAVLAVGVYLNVRLGLNTPERQDTLADSLFALVTLCLSLALGFLTFRLVLVFLDRTHGSSGGAGRHRG